MHGDHGFPHLSGRSMHSCQDWSTLPPSRSPPSHADLGSKVQSQAAHLKKGVMLYYALCSNCIIPSFILFSKRPSQPLNSNVTNLSASISVGYMISWYASPRRLVRILNPKPSTSPFVPRSDVWSSATTYWLWWRPSVRSLIGRARHNLRRVCCERDRIRPTEDVIFQPYCTVHYSLRWDSFPWFFIDNGHHRWWKRDQHHDPIHLPKSGCLF